MGKPNENKLDERAVIMELIVLDMLCTEEKVKMNIAIFGGAALILHLSDDVFRKTRDIDFRLEGISSQEKLSQIMKMMPNVFHELGSFPEFPDQELYLQNGNTYYAWKGVNFENLELFLPSIEMISLSKLMSTRGKDLEDLQNTPILDKCDLLELRAYVDEGKLWVLNDREYNYLEWDDLLLIRGLSLPEK